MVTVRLRPWVGLASTGMVLQQCFTIAAAQPVVLHDTLCADKLYDDGTLSPPTGPAALRAGQRLPQLRVVALCPVLAACSAVHAIYAGWPFFRRN